MIQSHRSPPAPSRRKSAAISCRWGSWYLGSASRILAVSQITAIATSIASERSPWRGRAPIRSFPVELSWRDYTSSPADLWAPARRPRYPRRVGNTWGRLFRVTTWGESHGAAIGAVVDGCPPRLPLSEADIQPDLDRRVPGQSALVSQRKETDTVKILSGVFEGRTLGTPISLEMANLDMRPGA